MTMMAKKKKKKGRPSLLDLQKRSLKQQQQLQQHRHKPNSPNLGSNPSRRSSRRYPNPDWASPPPELIVGHDDDDDDERKEKKHRLLLGFNSNSDCQQPTLSANPLSFNSIPFGSDSIADGDGPDVDTKRRMISALPHGSNQMSEKVLKATDNSIHGLQVESGPTTPLPDKKLLVFILDRLQKKDTYGVFSEPVDPEELPDYHEIIANPMDFGTVRTKLDGGVYTNLEQFEKDIFLICSNAMEYNSRDTIYFRQARSMQELAKKDFENLRQDSDDCKPQPKIVRRGRPPGKKLKKLIDSSPVECIGPESFSDTTLASAGENSNGSNTYNLRKGPNPNRLRPVDAPNGIFHGALGGETSTSWLYEWENEFPASVLRSVLKYGKKQFAVNENKRDSYRLPLASGHGPSTLAGFEGEQKQLIEVDNVHLEHRYARSLARFAADLGPVVWKIALEKIGSIFPFELQFGPGWTGEDAASKNERPLFDEKVLPNPAAVDLTHRLLPQRLRGSNPVGEKWSFLQGREDVETINTQKASPMLGVVGNTDSNAVHSYEIDLNGVNSVATSISDRRNFLGFVGESALQELARHHKQDSRPFLSDQNVGFRAPSSSSSILHIGSPRQPDLALQLRMGH